MNKLGGYGQIAHGRHKYGAQDSKDFAWPVPQPMEPRFNYSKPIQGTYNVDVDQWIVFELYYYSSSFFDDVLNPPAVPVLRISEDQGQTWLDAQSAPYTTTIRHKDGQVVWMKIVKNGKWTDKSEIQIAVDMEDEFGQSASLTYPVRWE
jgi:hypothetical protein